MAEFRLDWERAGRTGTSEAVLCEPKSAAQIDAIVAHATELGRRLLLTRLGPRKFGRLAASARDALDYDDATRTAILGGLPAARRRRPRGDRLRRHVGSPGRGRGGAHARVRRRRGDGRRRRRRGRAVAPHGAPRRDPAPSRGHRRGGHGGRALQRARGPRSLRGDRGADVGRLRRGRGRPHGAQRGARELRVRPCGRQHRQRIRRRARGAAHSRGCRPPHSGPRTKAGRGAARRPASARNVAYFCSVASSTRTL